MIVFHRTLQQQQGEEGEGGEETEHGQVTGWEPREKETEKRKDREGENTERKKKVDGGRRGRKGECVLR